MTGNLKHIRTFVTLVMAFIMLMVLGGFNLYTHYCSSHNSKNISIILPSDNCHHESDIETVACGHIEQESTCCTTNSDTSNTETDCNCCTDNAEYLKLNIDTLVNHQIPDIEDVSSVYIDDLLGEFRPCECLLDRELITLVKNNLPPPTPTPVYLSLIQVYLI